MDISYVCFLFWHFVFSIPTHLFFPFNIYACVGKKQKFALTLHSRNAGCTLCFNNHFRSFLVSPLLRWQVQMLVAHTYEGGEEESDLCFGSPCKSITCKKKGKDEQLPKSFIQPLVSSRALLHLRVGKKAQLGAGPPSPCPLDLWLRRSARQPADPRDKVFVRYSCPFRSGLDKIYFFTFISFVLSHALSKKENPIASDDQDAKWWLQLADN